MFSKKQRLSKKKDFGKIFFSGKIIQDSFLNIRFLANNFSYRRFAVVISSKVFKKAVKRNLIRRRLLSILRSLNFEKCFDMIVVVKKKEIALLSFEDLKYNLQTLLTKAKII